MYDDTFQEVNENKDFYYDSGTITIIRRCPNRHDDSHDMNDENQGMNYDSLKGNNKNHLLFYGNHDDYDDTPFFV